MGKTINKHMRVDEEHLKRIEKAAHERGITPVRLMIPAALEAIEGGKWPRTEAEIHPLRSAMFVAQAIIRDMERNGREEEIEQISRNISEIAPELPDKFVKGRAGRVDMGVVIRGPIFQIQMVQQNKIIDVGTSSHCQEIFYYGGIM